MADAEIADGAGELGLLQPAQLVAAAGWPSSRRWPSSASSSAGGCSSSARSAAGSRVIGWSSSTTGASPPTEAPELVPSRGYRPTPCLADSLSTSPRINWTDGGQPVTLMRRLPRQERRRLRGRSLWGVRGDLRVGGAACDAVRGVLLCTVAAATAVALARRLQLVGQPQRPGGPGCRRDRPGRVPASDRPPARQRLAGRARGPAGHGHRHRRTRCPRSR